MKFKIIQISILCSFFAELWSQSSHHVLQWDSTSFQQQEVRLSDLHFAGESHRTIGNPLPVFRVDVPVPGPGTLSVRLIIKDEQSGPLLLSPEDFAALQADYPVSAGVEAERGKYLGRIWLHPLKNLSGQELLLLRSFDLEWEFQPSPSLPPLPEYKTESVLSSGIWHRIAVPQRGIYRMGRDFFQQALNIDPKSIDPRRIQLFGNGGQMLPESTDDSFADDLVENAIYFKGETDGSFDEGDFILFYAPGPDQVMYDPSTEDYSYRKNIYEDSAYYFLRLGGETGKRIETVTHAGVPYYSSNQTYGYIHYENDLVNLLDLDPGGEGSGKDWYGDELSNTRELNFGNAFIFDHLDLSRNGRFSYSFAGRAAVQSKFFAEVEAKTVQSTINPIIYSSISRFAQLARKSESFQPVSDLVRAVIRYPQLSGNTASQGWLDYFQVSAWSNLVWGNKTLFILDPESAAHELTLFSVQQAPASLKFWDLTDPAEVQFMRDTMVSGGTRGFVANTKNQYRLFAAFDEGQSFPSPAYAGAIGNQNLHGFAEADMLIVYNRAFEEEATRLAAHRSSISGLRIRLAEQGQIFNEFSSGSQDPAAIRNFCRMLYLRDTAFKYLVLFGDGSYDLRHRNKKDPDENFIASYQTDESLDPIYAFPSDDFFGLLDPGESKNLSGKLDLNIGRLCARNPTEAKNLVDKIIRYDTDPRTHGEWKLTTVYSADDEDSNIHFHQAETIANKTKAAQPVFNQEKIYLDAFLQKTTPGGERYPDANQAFYNAFFQGSLVVNYLGHGGYTGLAQERVFQNTDIAEYDNYYKLPLVVVASCTFNGFDDPSKTNAGEEGLHNQNGGFLALFSTVRAVYSDDNFDLTQSVYENLLRLENGSPLSLGEVIRRAKNQHSSGFILPNSRKFLLFGDPAQQLAIPRLTNRVTGINGEDPATHQDTVRALERLDVEGVVEDHLGQVQTQFNGKLFVTVYDKEIQLSTKANDPGSTVAKFKLQKNVVYKGVVDVVSGQWNFSFIVPKDINYAFGQGKISLYSSDGGNLEGAGYEDRFTIGGVSEGQIDDTTPPVVKVFLNDSLFVSGGICGPNPKLYIQLSDDIGLNISGNSIGHDITAILDADSRFPVVLNPYFKASLTDPARGEVLYPLKGLTPGKHHIAVTAWDISNNPGYGELEFTVVDDAEFAVENMYNFPNPFDEKTTFNLATNQSVPELDLLVEIQSLSGMPVRTLRQTIVNNGFRLVQLVWDGRDGDGNELPGGVYPYRVLLTARRGNELLQKTTPYQKSVLVR
jgi:hypothetical protein